MVNKDKIHRIKICRINNLLLENKKTLDREEMVWMRQFEDPSMAFRVKNHIIPFNWKIKLGDQEFEEWKTR